MTEARPLPEEPFERAYAATLLDAPPPDPREPRREALEGHARAPARTSPSRSVAVCSPPDEALDDGWLVVSGATIAELRDTPPPDVRVIETGGIVLPGLIDLHGDPEYNVFAAWEPPKRYANRFLVVYAADFGEADRLRRP